MSYIRDGFLFFMLSIISKTRAEYVGTQVYDRQIPMEIHRIVAIGDIHGDAEHFRSILHMSGLTSTYLEDKGFILWQPKWGEKELELHNRFGTKLRTTLIQLGDLIDRGEEDLEVLKMAMSLYVQIQTNHTNDNMVLILGNHELLNLQGQFYYVHPSSLGGFSTKSVRKRAFEPDGEFGRFILENFTTIHVDEDFAFVHAGVSEHFASFGVDSLNKEVKRAIQKKDYGHSVLGSTGPLWTRQMIMNASSKRCSSIQKILSLLGVQHIVVGHTPQRSGHIETYCDDAVIAVDVGMSRWMYGNLAALEVMVTSLDDGNKTTKDIQMREISTTTTTYGPQTLEEGLNDSLVLEELQHAIQEFSRRPKRPQASEMIDDL
uniref:Putative serine/threonine protein phosphatase n=1 Tax=Trypanosoma vivax (strain Y486) TaxID=1055687 RepID=G0TW97_TRYVY|nr:putative serine/threonine protein phosphatase [Trypanosoma vivax Y486]